MKKVILSGIFGALATIFLVSCESKTETVETTDDDAVLVEEDAGDVDVTVDANDTLAEFNRTKDEWTVRFSENEKRIATARANLDKMEAKARADYEKRVAAAEKRNRELQEEVHSYKYERQKNWEEFKARFNRDLDEINRDLETNN